MSDGMSDGRDYGPSLSKHGAPLISKEGKPLDERAAAESRVKELELQLGDTQITLNQEIDRLRDIAEDHRLLTIKVGSLERQLIEERKRCAEIASYYNDPKKIGELILAGDTDGEWKDWLKKEEHKDLLEKEERKTIRHCYSGHCSYFIDRRCICLCSRCEEAKKADH